MAAGRFDAERFASAVKMRGLTQASVARAIRVSTAIVSRWSTGQRPPGRDNLLRLADCLQVSVDWLLGLSDDGGPGASGAPLVPQPVGPSGGAHSPGPPGATSQPEPSDRVDWKAMAQRLLDIMERREANEELRIRTVEAPDAQARADLAAAVRSQSGAQTDADASNRQSPSQTGGDGRGPGEEQDA